MSHFDFGGQMLHHWKKVEHKPISSHKTLLNLKLLTFGISHLEKIKQICNNKEEQKVNKNLFLIIINFLTKTSCKKLRAASRDLLFTKMAWSNWCVFFYKIKKIEEGINKISISDLFQTIFSILYWKFDNKSWFVYFFVCPFHF